MSHPLARGAWRRDAACLGMDPEDFYPGTAEDESAAKAVCARCPVLDACLEDAVLHGDYHGVRGAMAGHERQALVRLARQIAA